MTDEKIAVALDYQRGVQPAPKVIAKGKGELAAKIIEIAEEHGIEIKKDEDLVTILEAVEIDEFIPMEAFSAVAEILKHLYKANDEQFARKN